MRRVTMINDTALRGSMHQTMIAKPPVSRPREHPLHSPTTCKEQSSIKESHQGVDTN